MTQHDKNVPILGRDNLEVRVCIHIFRDSEKSAKFENVYKQGKITAV